MIISERQIMKLIRFTNQLSDFLLIEKTKDSLEVYNDICAFLNIISLQQSNELKEFK